MTVTKSLCWFSFFFFGRGKSSSVFGLESQAFLDYGSVEVELDGFARDYGLLKPRLVKAEFGIQKYQQKVYQWMCIGENHPYIDPMGDAAADRAAAGV